ncbi:MAG: hypothetical protein U1A78_18935 [Polyangia bacterium]
MPEPRPESASVIAAPVPLRPRKIDTVPYVELWNRRVQGVVSSDSDPSRVYVSFFEAGTTNFNCSTNNNRPCGGLRGGPCKHLMRLLDEAVLQFGAETVGRYLQLSGDLSKVKSARELAVQIRGSQSRQDVSQVFSRFLSYLASVELVGSNLPVPEMTWFVAG